MKRKELEIENFFDLSKTDYAEYYREVKYPWDIVKEIPNILAQKLEGNVEGDVSSAADLGQQVHIGQGSVVEEGARIQGPAIVGKNCRIRSGAYVRSNVLVGDEVTVGHSTEVKRSLIHDEAELPHFSYVGDSVIGWKGHLGAGVKVSNLKVTREPVVVHLGKEDIETGMRKFGCVMGDRVEIGCNSVLNPGTLIGKGTLAMANISLSGYYPPESFVKMIQEIEITEKEDGRNS